MSASADPAFPRSHERTAVHRRRLRAIDAFIDLVLEGHLPPNPKQVAERAKISMATFFRYFENLNSMRRDAAVRMAERFPLLEIEAIGEGPLKERVERFTDLRVKLWEKVHLLALLQRSTTLHDSDAAEMIEDVRYMMAQQIQEHFAPELQRLTTGQREDAVALIATLTSVESWEQYRHAYKRSPLQTRRSWSHTIYAALAAAEDSR